MLPTQRQIDLMDSRDRQQFPRKIRLTTSERAAEGERKTERELHNQICSFLNKRKLIFGYVHCDPTKKSRIQPGWPDFSIIAKIHGKHKSNTCCLVEVKIPGGTLSKSQMDRFHELSRANIDIFLVSTLHDFIEVVCEYFGLTKESCDVD